MLRIYRISCLAALSFCLRDSADPYYGLPCTFGTHDRDSPEPLHDQFSLFFDGILNVSTVLFKNLHILYHGIFCFAICNVYKISDVNIKNRVGVHKYDRQEGNLSVGNVILQRLFMHGTEPLPLYRPLPHRFCRRGWSYRALHTCSEERRVRPAPRAW